MGQSRLRPPEDRARSPFLTAALLCITCHSAMAEPAAAPCPLDGLYRAVNTMDLEHAWSGTPLMRDMEAECDSSDFKVTYWQLRAGGENLLGHHARALTDFTRFLPQRNQQAPRPELPPGAQSAPAIPYITTQSRTHQIVMVNERHHVSTDRLLTLALLRPLYAQGFRYLAIEALWAGDEELNERGYAVRESGGYISDVVFGELIREAIALGYELVPYEASREQQAEATDTLNQQQRRDYWQAKNMLAATLDRDPDAKVLVHCGYAHLVELPTERWTSMAHYLHEATGLDPLTVDQTRLAEHGDAELEHGWRLDAKSRRLLTDQPIVLLDANGNLLRDGPNSVDIRVMGPATQYANGRPTWMQMHGRRNPIPIETPECTDEPCVVAAFNPTWEDRAVPYVRIEVQAPTADLYLPQATEIELRAYHLNGDEAFHRKLTTTR